MAIKIPVYNSQVTPTLQTSGARTPLTVVDDSTGAALQQAGAAVGQLAEAQQKLQDSQDLLAAQKTYADTVAGYQQGLVDMQGRAAPGAPDFTRDAMSAYDESVKGALSGIQNPRVRTFMDEQYTEYRQKAFSTALGFEAEQQRKFAVSNTSDAINASASASARDPSQYVPMLAGLNVSIDNSILPPDVKATLRQSAKDNMSAAVGMRMVADDPAGAYAVLTQKPDQPLPAGYEWVHDLPAQKLVALQGHARSLVAQQQNALDRAALQRENDAAAAHNQALDLVNAGKQLSPDYTSQLLTTTAGTAVAEQTRRLVEVAGQRAGFASSTLAQQAATLQRYQTEASSRGTDPETAAAVKQLEQIHTASVQAYKTDPWNAALDRGVLQQVPAVDTSSVPSLAASLASRVQMAGAVEQAAGRRVSLMTPDEARSVLQTVDALPTNTKAQALAMIGRSMGNAARINDLAEQWKDKSPASALAMKAGAADPSGGPLMMQSGMPVAQYILDGQDALSNKLVKVDAAAATGLQATIAKQIGDSLPPQQLGDARETAYFAAVASARKNGRDVPNSTDILTGVNVATGGLSKTGGVDPRGDRYMAAKPWGWSDDDFDAGVKQASAANIENPGVDSVLANGVKIPVADFMKQFASYRLQRVGIGGTYTVLTGARPVTDPSGAPLLVHLTKPTPKR
ncbi:hypothetical protein C7S15_1375 [Burkholderia cepacia]|uniref:hypothetical protein n=1 Tax=Burkholderia cepacia TaxID=292 RepID=UPI00299068E5|nr:hypothetical protein [Burkholderia cepacia]MDW9226814.1 hypothetical protein [Burkholderia cepacia]